MKYYAHFGHKDFILCLGHQADEIKNYFVNYNEYVSNDFIYSNGGADLKLISKDIEDWTITFADTGVNSNVGQRLMAVEKYLEGEETFLANYSDGLSDLPLPEMIDRFNESGATAMLMAAQPNRTFHVVSLDSENHVSDFKLLSNSGLWINAGYFIFKREIFNHMNPGEDLENGVFKRLIKQRQLIAYPYNGSFYTMDTFKEKQMLDDMYAKGDTPWEVWKTNKYQKRTA